MVFNKGVDGEHKLPLGCWAIIVAFTVIIISIIGAENPDEDRVLTREESYRECFWAWNGQWLGKHKNLENLVRYQLLDPSSYKHIRTQLRSDDTVYMVYSARSKLGLTVTKEIIARTNLECKVLEILFHE